MSYPITITLNGSPKTFDEPLSLLDLLDRIGLRGKPVVVELNQQAVFPRDYQEIQIENGASIELVILAAGG